MEELWVRDNDTSNLRLILDPLAIKTNIISVENNDVIGIDKVIMKNNEISNNSNLNNIEIMFFRHQNILRVLKIIIIMVNFILEFSTSKVDIFINY